MPIVTYDEAVDLLTKVVENDLPADELLEVYTERFPMPPPNGRPLSEPIVDYLKSGLAPDELVDLWRIICTKHRHIWYNEEEERIYYNEGLEAFSEE